MLGRIKMKKNYLIFGIILVLCFGVVSATNYIETFPTDTRINVAGTHYAGYVFYTTNIPSILDNITKDTSTGALYAYLFKDTVLQPVASATFVGDVATFNYTMDINTTYYILIARGGFDQWAIMIKSASPARSNNLINIPDAYAQGDSGGGWPPTPNIVNISQHRAITSISVSDNSSNTPPYVPPTYENKTFNNVTTTDLNTVPDIQAVENFTIASSTSSVQWTNPVNLENVTNIASVIITTRSFIAVDKQVVPSLDTPADVSLTPPSYGNPCQNFILYYSPGFYTTQADIVNNGQIVATAGNIGYDCLDPTICTNVQCTNGILTFRAEHFDGFAIGEVDAATQQSCSGTRSIIYAGFALLAVLVIAGAVALILATLSGGNIDTATIASLMIGLGVIIMIGFIVIYYVSKSLC
jgi:hypothetical protein